MSAYGGRCGDWRTFDKAALLAKKALMRPIDSSNEDPYYADLEVEMLDKINKLGNRPPGIRR